MVLRAQKVYVYHQAKECLCFTSMLRRAKLWYGKVLNFGRTLDFWSGPKREEEEEEEEETFQTIHTVCPQK